MWQFCSMRYGLKFLAKRFFPASKSRDKDKALSLPFDFCPSLYSFYFIFPASHEHDAWKCTNTFCNHEDNSNTLRMTVLKERRSQIPLWFYWAGLHEINEFLYVSMIISLMLPLVSWTHSNWYSIWHLKVHCCSVRT